MSTPLTTRSVTTEIRQAFLRAFLDRSDIFATVLMDGALVVGAVVVRYYLLLVFHQFAPEEVAMWPVRTLEWIMDIGMVGTAAIYTAFDLLKRVTRSGREWLDEFGPRPVNRSGVFGQTPGGAE